MPLFTKTNFREGVSEDRNDRWRHLSYVVNPGLAVARAPEMGGNGTTVVFLPYPDFSDPNYKATNKVLDDRLSDDPLDFSDWLFHAEGVMKFGPNPVTFLFDDPIDGNGYQFAEQNPVQMICDAAYRAGKADKVIETPFGNSDQDRWSLLYNGGKDNSGKEVFKAIPRPQRLVMGYALVYSSGKVNYAMQGVPYGGAAGDLPVVFVMSQHTTREGLCAAIGQTVGEENALRLKHPVVTGTKFIHFYDKQKSNCPALQNAAMSQTMQLGGVRRQNVTLAAAIGDQKGTEIGYGIHVTDTYTGMPNDSRIQRAACAALACGRLRPWDQVVRGYKPEAAAKLIADHCNFPWSLLYHAWKSCPEYYPEEMRARLRSLREEERVGGGVRQPAFPSAGVGITSPIVVPAATVAETPTPNMFGLGGGAAATVAVASTDPGAAPWGGNISDPPDSDLSGGTSADAAEIYNGPAAADAMARLRQHMAQTGMLPRDTVARTVASQTPPAGGK